MNAAEKLTLLHRAEESLHTLIRSHAGGCDCEGCLLWHRVYRLTLSVEKPGREGLGRIMDVEVSP
jgi:hypothetical protein